jgi:hypothetical protein
MMTEQSPGAAGQLSLSAVRSRCNTILFLITATSLDTDARFSQLA